MFQSKISFFTEYLDYFVFRRATRICACSSLRMIITSRCRYSKDESSRFTWSFKIFSLCDGWEWHYRVSIWTGGLINKNQCRAACGCCHWLNVAANEVISLMMRASCFTVYRSNAATCCWNKCTLCQIFLEDIHIQSPVHTFVMFYLDLTWFFFMFWCRHYTFPLSSRETKYVTCIKTIELHKIVTSVLCKRIFCSEAPEQNSCLKKVNIFFGWTVPLRRRIILKFNHATS